MTRISRTAALSAAAVLALGITACSPPHQKNSDSTHVTDVTPESGYTGGGVPETSASESAEATAAELETGVESGFVTTEEPVAQ
ncbi:hypothetical protein [Corynebacterium variabile]|uniref:hypothetical protein n=1 Tax=Corynebacterium variabile TaxID=1727 RepID=UPI002897D4E8|nr:hypothetical protein [Corynebacterium variabile]